jgi:hypothetical protein
MRFNYIPDYIKNSLNTLPFKKIGWQEATGFNLLPGVLNGIILEEKA